MYCIYMLMHYTGRKSLWLTRKLFIIEAGSMILWLPIAFCSPDIIYQFHYPHKIDVSGRIKKSSNGILYFCDQHFKNSIKGRVSPMFTSENKLSPKTHLLQIGSHAHLPSHMQKQTHTWPWGRDIYCLPSASSLLHNVLYIPQLDLDKSL